MNEQTITIKEALGFPEGTPIPRIKGELVKLGERESKEGDYGPYTKQWGIIRDGSDSILFTAWKHENIPQSHVGKILIFRAGGGRKPTLKLESDYKDKSKRTLKVTESCPILTEDEETDDIPMEFNTKTPEQPKNAPKANVESKKAILGEALEGFMGSKPDPKKDIQEVKKRVMQYANLREITDHAAYFLYQDELDSSTMQAPIKEKIKDVSSCFFIQGIRDGLHLKLPNNKPLSKKENVESKEDLESKKDEEF